MGWTCDKCTLRNQDRAKACEACGSTKQIVRTGILPLSIERNLNDLAHAVVEIFTPPIPPPKPQPPRYNIHALPTPDSPAREKPPRPPPPASHAGLDESLPSTSNTLQRQIEAKVDPDFATYSLTIRDRERTDEEKAKQIFDNIMATCKALKEPFIDPDFAHNMTSIGNYREKNDVVKDDLMKEDPIWLRPSQIFTKDGRRWIWATFRDPQPSDIEQGTLGDCWLLSAMALLAERPDILEQIVLTKEYNPVGVYQIRVCIDGEWKIITVDDFFPCRASSRSLAFATGRKNQLWVPLIEKALAKALGSYEKLRAGRTIEGLTMLTGASCITLHLEDEDSCTDTIWAQLISAKEAGFVLGCSCGAGSRPVNDEEYKKKGLLSRHAYSILDVRQEGPHRLLRLRNPWGTFVWNGSWSDNWSGWPPGLRTLLLERQMHDRGNGAFWISFPDFLAHFDSVDIARVRSTRNWSELRVPVSLGGSFTEENRSLRVIVEGNTEVCISLFQSGSRTKQDRSDLMLCVHEVTANGHVGELVTRSARKIENFVTTGEIFLRPGHYIVVCHSLASIGQRSHRHKGMLVVHSNRPLYCEQLPCPAQMYSDSLVHMLSKEGKTHSSVEGCIPRYLTKDFGGLIMMIDNYHEKMYMQVKIECSGSQNVTSSRSCMEVADSVPPMHRQIIILLSHFEPTQSYLVQHRMSVRSSRRPGLTDWSHLDPNAFHFPPFENRDMALLHEYKPLFY